ncbi:MAG: O-antigen ligase family protein [Bacilli bacterium]
MKKKSLALRKTMLFIYIVLSLLGMKIYYSNLILSTIFLIYMILSFDKVKINKTVVILILITTFCFVIPSFFYGNLFESFKMLCQMIIVISPILIYNIELEGQNNIIAISKDSLLCNIIKLLLFLLCFINVIYLTKNPYFARNMANYNYNVPGVHGIALFSGGGYYLIYGLIFLSLYLLNYIFTTQKVFFKCLGIVMYFFVGFVIFKANFATSFILYIVGAIIFMFLKNLKKKKLFNIIILLIALLGILNYQKIFSSLSQIFPKNSIIYIRINDAINNSEESTYNERLLLVKRSISAIKDKPIFGNSHKYRYNYNLMKESMGLHTEWLDVFAKYGIFIFIEYIVIIFYSFKRLLNDFKNTKYYNLFLSSFFLLLILGFLNPISNTSVYVFIYLVLPILCNGGKTNEI